MILIDSSAWIEFLRGTGSEVCEQVDALLEGDIATTDPIVMEILSGARNDVDVGRLTALLGRCQLYTCRSEDFLAAAQLFRAVRGRGETVRSSVDCLIAAVAIRERLTVLHVDHDFEILARHSHLLLHGES